MSQNHCYLTGINRPALQASTDHLLSDAAAVPADLVTCFPVNELHLSLLQSDHMLAYSTCNKMVLNYLKGFHIFTNNI